MGKTIVLALGGNAIIRAKEKGTRDEQWHNIEKTCRNIAELIKQGHRIVITHGNGPQVGNILIKNEMAKDIVPQMPLDVIVSNTQGGIGYCILQTMENYCASIGLNIPIVALVTQVVVNPNDPAFSDPTKFVGTFYGKEEAEALALKKNYVMKEDFPRGWRRVVPSPKPEEIVEDKIIKQLVNEGILVIAAGGGGIPVVRTPNGLVGIEAVIDKDLASEKLAVEIGADTLFLLTEVERVCINYGTPHQKELKSMTVKEALEFYDQGQFPSGSMGPKIEAAIKFAKAKENNEAYIVSMDKAHLAFSNESGTVIRG
jgi:carbamate kinase